MRPAPLDLELAGVPGMVSSYLVTEPEPLLVDPGPSTTLAALRRGLGAAGLDVAHLRRIVLTHVHLDHAGGTGHLVRENPDLVVHVHEGGAPHLVDPSRLVSSTRRTFGNAHDLLWGEVLPVPASRITAWREGDPDPVPGLRPIPTPGHIDHHVAYLHERSATLLAGDALGIILADDAPTVPATPPPSLDLVAWDRTLERLEGVEAEWAAVAHFGLHGAVDERRAGLRVALRELEARVRRAMAEEDATAAGRYADEVLEAQAPHVPSGRAERYFRVFGGRTDWRGVEFYLERLPHE